MRLIFSISFIFLSLLQAQTPINTNNTMQNNSKYNIEDIINITLQTHPTIRMNKEIIKGSEAQLKGAKWGYYPTPSISSFQTQDSLFGATLSLEQPLFTGGKLDANYDLALANKKSSEYALEDSAYTIIETLLDTIKTYIQSENTYTALLEGQKQLRILEGMVQRRVAAGVSSRADMELLMARLYQMDTDLNLAKTKKETALAQIEIMTGRQFDNNLIVELSAPVVNGTVSEVIDETMNTHPLLKKLDAQREYTKAELDKSKAKSGQV
jgi:adhesin transport system outer membrane protein